MSARPLAAPGGRLGSLVYSRELLRYLWERSGSRSLRWRRRFEPGEGVVRDLSAWVASWQAKPRISVCVASTDRLDLLVPCLASLGETSAGRPVEVLIGDTRSSEATLRFYADIGIPVVGLPAPFDFSRACNELARAANGDWLLFLNNDTQAVTRDWVQRLLETPRTELAGATLVYPGTRRLQHGGFGVTSAPGRRWGSYGEDSPFALQNIGLGRRLDDLAERRASVMAVTGACLFTSRAQFDAAGGFDEDYRVDLQDIDYCLRCRKLGNDVVRRGDVVFSHRHAGTRGRYVFPVDDWRLFAGRWESELGRWQAAPA